MTESDAQRRLAEMDDRLRAIQAELEADVGAIDAPTPPPRAEQPPPRSEPPPPRSDPPPPPEAPLRSAPRPPARPEPPANPHLEAMTARLLAAMRELMAGYEIALAHVAAGTSPTAAAVTVAAGPFTGMEMLRRFEQALRALPEVSEVSVRGYEGADRAIVEVQLGG